MFIQPLIVHIVQGFPQPIDNKLLAYHTKGRESYFCCFWKAIRIKLWQYPKQNTKCIADNTLQFRGKYCKSYNGSGKQKTKSNPIYTEENPSGSGGIRTSGSREKSGLNMEIWVIGMFKV